MKMENGQKSISGWHVASVLLFLAIVGIVSVSMFLKTDDGERETLIPQELDVKMTPSPLGQLSHPTEKDIYMGLVGLDSLARDMYSLEAESSQGSNQVKLFFSRKSWSNAYNRNVYIISVLWVVILLLCLKNISHRYSLGRKIWTAGALSRRQHYLIPFFALLAALVAILNLSMPYDVEHRFQADWFFVIVALTCVGIVLRLALRVIRMTRNPKFWNPSAAVRRNHRTNTLLWAALLGWALAFLCFFIVLYNIGTRKSLLACLFRPALSATKMFVLADSVDELPYVFLHSGVFMGFYSFVKVFVLIVTSVSILSLVWYRLSGHYRLMYTSAADRDLYVFFGINDNTVALASSMKDMEKDGQPYQPVLIFVESKENGAALFSESPTVGNFIQMFTHRREAFDIAEKWGAQLLLGKVSLCSPECQERMAASTTASEKATLWEDLGLTKLQELISECTNAHLLLLDDNERMNIQAAETLRSVLLATKTRPQGAMTIYCHASVHAVGDSFAVSESREGKPIVTHVLDSSQLSVQTLLMDKHSTYHPVNYVKVNASNATVESDFNAWVLGFGETGQSMVRFLYEFGAFLPKECGAADATATYRSPFRCDIFDKDIDTLAGSFVAGVPAVAGGSNFTSSGIREHEDDCFGKHFCFHKGLPRLSDLKSQGVVELSKVNYFVLALGSDEQNLTALKSLMDAVVVSRRKNLDNLVVLVRNYQRENSDAMHHTEDYYNSLLEKPVVKVFGEKNKLFSYDIVIQDAVIANAIKFYDKYREIEGGNATWQERNSVSDKKGKLWETYQGIRRKVRQDMNNYIHIATKLQLIGIGPDELKDVSNQKRVRRYERLIEFVRVHEFSAEGKVIPSENGFMQTKLNGEENLLTNLARTEHLRWNASHEMLGYVANKGTGCDELSRTHNCLADWEELDHISEVHNAAEVTKADKERYLVDYKAFDFMVVKTTFGLLMENADEDK